MIRTEPLKAGRSNDTLASPLASDAHHGRIEARGSWVGQIAFHRRRCLRRPVWIGARRRLHAVDQQAVEIANLDRQLALSRRNNLSGLAVLNPVMLRMPDIDRRDRDGGLFAGRKASELDRQASASGAGGPFRGRRGEKAELMRILLDGRTRQGRARGRAFRLALASSGRWVSATA